MKKKSFQWFFRMAFFMSALAVVTFSSCSKDEEDDTTTPANPIASFQFEVSTTNFLQVTFTNFSQNAATYEWNFGDGQTSTEKDPVHVYTVAGNYTVVLTAKNSAGTSATFNKALEITDPNSALALLAGTTSKTWRLLREGTSLGVGPDATAPRTWWSLNNDGSRACVYYHSFTFGRDGSFVFEDEGSFWGEEFIFTGTAVLATCFDATAANMVNSGGADVSAWLGGTHAFTYDAINAKITLTGTGAWMGLPQLGTTVESIVPEGSKTFGATIEEFDTYDLLHISYTYAALYWDFTYASYDNPADEPEVVTESVPWGEDLENVTPTAIFNTFNSADATDVQELVPTTSAVVITPGVDDPADATAAKVGQYVRGVELYSDLKFQLAYDCQFDNFTSFSIDVYIPSTNTYSEGGLTTGIQLWIADASQTQEFWTSWVQYDVNPADVVMDEWKTYTFDLETPSSGVGTPKTRTDLDLVGLVIGGSGHAVDGTFYIRNFVFN